MSELIKQIKDILDATVSISQNAHKIVKFIEDNYVAKKEILSEEELYTFFLDNVDELREMKTSSEQCWNLAVKLSGKVAKAKIDINELKCLIEYYIDEYNLGKLCNSATDTKKFIVDKLSEAIIKELDK